MRVNVDDLDVVMELGNNGILLSIYDNDGIYKGKLRVGKGTIEWCKGRIRVGNGVKKNWDDFISIFEGE